MVVVTGLIGTGKTVEAIKQCARHHWVFVTEYPETAYHIQELARRLKLKVEVTTYARLTDIARRNPGGASGYFIEDINSFMNYMLGDTVRGFICEGEDVIVTCKDDKLGFYRKDIHSL